jgi:hypothetical protein
MKKQNVSIIDGLIVASMGNLWIPGQIIAKEILETQILSMKRRAIPE